MSLPARWQAHTPQQNHIDPKNASCHAVLAVVQDPKRRATADKVLQHPWMRENGTASSAPLDNIILKRMQAGRMRPHKYLSISQHLASRWNSLCF